MSAPQWFRRLLRLLPFDFRADYGREMEQVFRDQHRDAGGRLARTGVWLQAIADLVARRPARAPGAASPGRPGTRSAGCARNPGFVAVAIITLALGIGTNTAMFSVVHAVLLRPLPYGDPERLVRSTTGWTAIRELALSDPEYLDYSERTRTLTLAAVSTASMNLTGDALESERVLAAAVTPNIFDVLGVQPALGRAFRPRRRSPGPTASLVLTDRLWRRRYGGDPSVVGETITVERRALSVVGVMPELPDAVRLRFGAAGGAARPLRIRSRRAAQPPRRPLLGAFARLRPGVTHRGRLGRHGGRHRQPQARVSRAAHTGQLGHPAATAARPICSARRSRLSSRCSPRSASCC